MTTGCSSAGGARDGPGIGMVGVKGMWAAWREGEPSPAQRKAGRINK